MQITRDFTATTYIVHDNKVLLHLHKKFGVWLPVGGHLDPHELPEEAALREIAEECGLEVELFNPDRPVVMKDSVELHRPMHIILEQISEGHEHMDMIYYARAKSDRLQPGLDESAELEWFTAEEVKAMTNIPDNARVMSLEALKLLKK